MSSKNQAQEKPRGSSIATNRKARRDYHVLETFEAGIELRGTEVKSIRGGRVSLIESYAKLKNGEAFLHELDIQPYEFGNVFNHNPRRVRRLLLHKKEIERLFAKAQIKGLALVPLKLYFKRGRVKVEMGLCRGKHVQDKRETIKRRTADREAARAIAAHKRR